MIPALLCQVLVVTRYISSCWQRKFSICINDDLNIGLEGLAGKYSMRSINNPLNLNLTRYTFLKVRASNLPL